MRARLTVLAICVIAVATVAAVVAAAQRATARPAHVTAADAVVFTPLQPKNPKGTQVAVVAGDLTQGPVTFFMKFGQGRSPLHAHSAGYHATVIRGQARHWAAGEEAHALVLGPGSHWYEPARRDHGDECVSDECLLLVAVEGPFDSLPAQKK